MKHKKKKLEIVERFSPKSRLTSHPSNRKVVDDIKKEIIKYIKSKYGFFERTKYDEWYVGITHDDDQRTKGHKSKKKAPSKTLKSKLMKQNAQSAMVGKRDEANAALKQATTVRA